MSLTRIQSEILKFIEQELERSGVAPTTREICEEFGFSSFGTVSKHMKKLEVKGYLRRGGIRNKQGVRLANRAEAISIPLLGSVVAGAPVEELESSDQTDVPESLLSNGADFALTVRGESMIEAGIMEDDVVIVKSVNTAKNGDIVVAVIDGETTVKYFYKKSRHIELLPANSTMEPIMVTPENEFEIRGIVVGLQRRY